ncbi:MAG: glutamine--tRNA ligase [Rhodothermaceae bacterium]|nr:MAG: glutamine--tRNA ligase [Rhodothermaceae bacterium]
MAEDTIYTPVTHPDRDDAARSNFIRDLVEEDLRSGRIRQVVVRFPPEPNGYLHIGHAKSICLNFGLAEEFGGVCHLRFDDTNPETEDLEYVEAIKRDVRWLGFDWGDREFYASDYFEQLYDWAVELIKQGKAYVDDLSLEEIREYRGTVTEPGRESPYRNRTVEENLRLFAEMRAGKYRDGEKVLRARIDMASPNMKMRDPLMYRIRHARHYRRGTAWCIYPMYDWAHGQSDAIEGITHSICTLEFENNRELYDWFLDNLGIDPRPHQYEFARLNLTYTVMSKRKLRALVEGGYVRGWDDPRMPTISGMRRRGITPEAIRRFCERIGVTKVDSRVDVGLLEHTIRDDLNFRAPRVMGVLRPLKVVLTNYPEGRVEWLDASYWPHDVPKEGSRKVPFGRELYIEQDDFMEDPPRRFHRLAPGREVRLRYAYIIRCEEVVKDADGNVVELRCTYDPETKSGGARANRRVKGTIHWVEATHALPMEVRLYDRLFNVPDPEEASGDGREDFIAHLNPASLVVLPEARIEPSVADDPPETRYQFERQGYFWQDPVDSKPGALVFNRIVSLRDSWARIARKAEAAPAQTSHSPRPGPAKSPAPAPVERDPYEALTPAQRRRFDRLTGLGLGREEASVLAVDAALAAYFEQVRAVHDNPVSVANWLVHEVQRARKETPLEALPFGPEAVGRLVALVDRGVITGRIAKEVFEEMMAHGGDPETIVETRGLRQVADPEALALVVEAVLAAFPEKVVQYREGKKGLLGFFVGQVMQRTQGRANPELARDLLTDRLATT